MDEGGFRALFDEHLTGLWRFARRRCGTATEADVVVAETFLVAWRRREDVPDGDAARLWLFGCPRRIQVKQNFEAPGSAGTTIEFYDFGADITITPPD